MTHSDLQLLERFLEQTKHLGLREAADLVGKSHQTIARWRNGDTERLTHDSRRAIERALASDKLAQSRAQAGQSKPLFVVSNHHVQGCGDPPFIDGDRPATYHSYFENQYGEQALFIYDRKTDVGALRMGDAGWDGEYPVEDGFVDLILGQDEVLWLVASWAAATHQSAYDVLRARDAKVKERAAELQAELEGRLRNAGADRTKMLDGLGEELGAGHGSRGES